MLEFAAYRKTLFREGLLRPAGKNVILPEPPDIFRRDKKHAKGLQFSPQCKDIIINPVRHELDNNELLEYLSSIKRADSAYENGENIGIVFFVNDLEGDTHNGIREENRRTTEYLSALARRQTPPQDLDLPEGYREIAEEIIKNDRLEIRVDSAHSQEEQPHFGKMFLHLLRLANALKDPLQSNHDTILHWHNVDLKLHRNHFEVLRAGYDKGSVHNGDFITTNFSKTDMLPKTHEKRGEEDKDISRELLLTLDTYRLYQNAHEAFLFINGQFPVGSVTISGRFSHFFPSGPFVHPTFESLLEEYATDPDFAVAYIMRAGTDRKSAIGTYGEVFPSFRATTPTTPASEPVSTDSERVYHNVVNQEFILNAFHQSYSMPEHANDYIKTLTSAMRTQNFRSHHLGHRRNFLEREAYQEILRREQKIEKEKVERRRKRLQRYIDYKAYGTQLTPEDQRTMAPYLRYFDEEVAFVDGLIDIQKSRQQKVDSAKVTSAFLEKYPQYNSFFDPTAEIHTNIATLRALSEYMILHNVNLLDDFLDNMPSED